MTKECECTGKKEEQLEEQEREKGEGVAIETPQIFVEVGNHCLLRISGFLCLRVNGKRPF